MIGRASGTPLSRRFGYTMALMEPDHGTNREKKVPFAGMITDWKSLTEAKEAGPENAIAVKHPGINMIYPALVRVQECKRMSPDSSLPGYLARGPVPLRTNFIKSD